MMTTAFKPIWWMLALAGVASPALAEDPWRGIDLAPPPGEIDQVDTFDLVEQTLGHPIHLPKIA